MEYEIGKIRRKMSLVHLCSKGRHFEKRLRICFRLITDIKDLTGYYHCKQKWQTPRKEMLLN